VSKIENSVLDTISLVVRNILADQGADVRRDQDLRDDLGLDSADIAELLVELEARLGVALPDTVFVPAAGRDPLGTVGYLVDAVVEHCAKVDEQ
jgi:acyl carrier protein